MKNKNTHKRGYWTKKRCHQEALGYSNTAEFLKARPYVYARAKIMGWFEDICSHMERLTVPRGYWNVKQHCIEEGKKYTTRTSFARNAPTAYQNCIKNGWNEAFSAMNQKYDYSHSYEECAAIALKCKSQAQMQREYPKQYSYACRHHFLKEIFSHIPKNESVTIEQAKEAASKCTLRQEFRIRFPREYRFTVHHHLLDEVCKDMISMHDMSKRCIYAFEFPDKHVYVGLTCNMERRKHEHFNENKSAVFLHKQKTGLVPILIIKNDYIDFYKAKELEGIVLREYTDAGWRPLNRTGTGGIGCRGSVYSQIRACTERIKFCEDFNQFAERFPDAYNICLKNDWFDILEEYLGEKKGDTFVPRRGFKKTNVPTALSANFVKRMQGQSVAFRYTDEELMIEGHKYHSKHEFDRSNNVAYRQAKKRGIIDKLFPVNLRQVPNERLFAEAAKYSNREEFKIGSNSAYQLALRRHLLDEICKDMPYHGYKNERIMIAAESRKINGIRQGGYKYWTKARIIEEIKKYNTISEFITKSSGAYDAARDMGILDEIKQYVKPRIITWTNAMLAEEAQKYNHRGDFQKGSRKAYDVAWKRGLLDEICSHMKSIRKKG